MKKCIPPGQFTFWKYNGKSIFSLFEILTKTLKIFFLNRNMDIFDLGKWLNWKYTYSCICVFSVWPLPEVENWFLKQIWKNRFFIFFFKLWIGRGGYIFSSKLFSEKAKHLRMCPSIDGNVGENWLRQGPIITRPYYKQPLYLLSWNFERMFTPPNMSHVMCHVKCQVTCHVTCHVTCQVTCHMSHVTCHMSFFFFFLDKVVKLIGGGSVINGAYPV